MAARIFKAIGDATINVDMIVQNISHGAGKPATDLSFTMDKPDLLKTRKVIDGLKSSSDIAKPLRTKRSESCPSWAWACEAIRRGGEDVRNPGARKRINIEMISTSEIKISVVIELAKGEQAMKAVHAAFIGSN